ncbi:hypothetical protein H4219_004157 [Mycoemilia scoparia]|uniref:Uncharacterized protein n=1 Tax=Mycoemilia scoparia TaxID=417184 RepID=A0A9W8DRU7_9FUNG|nr:hypothetical protein H4219_004157 [Mycoemilia scoparia]
MVRLTLGLLTISAGVTLVSILEPYQIGVNSYPVGQHGVHILEHKTYIPTFPERQPKAPEAELVNPRAPVVAKRDRSNHQLKRSPQPDGHRTRIPLPFFGTDILADPIGQYSDDQLLQQTPSNNNNSSNDGDDNFDSTQPTIQPCVGGNGCDKGQLAPLPVVIAYPPYVPFPCRHRSQPDREWGKHPPHRGKETTTRVPVFPFAVTRTIGAGDSDDGYIQYLPLCPRDNGDNNASGDEVAIGDGGGGDYQTAPAPPTPTACTKTKCSRCCAAKGHNLDHLKRKTTRIPVFPWWPTRIFSSDDNDDSVKRSPSSCSGQDNEDDDGECQKIYPTCATPTTPTSTSTSSSENHKLPIEGGDGETTTRIPVFPWTAPVTKTTTSDADDQYSQSLPLCSSDYHEDDEEEEDEDCYCEEEKEDYYEVCYEVPPTECNTATPTIIKPPPEQETATNTSDSSKKQKPIDNTEDGGDRETTTRIPVFPFFVTSVDPKGSTHIIQIDYMNTEDGNGPAPTGGDDYDGDGGALPSF